MRHFFTVSNTILGCLFLALLFAPIEAQAQGLFTGKGDNLKNFPYHDATIDRARTVEINPGLMPTVKSAPGSALLLNLFSDLSISCYLDKLIERDKTNYSWVCGIENDALGKAIITVYQGVLVANIRSSEKGYYQVRVAPDGTQEVRQIDENGFRPCGNENSDVINNKAPEKPMSHTPDKDLDEKVDQPTIFDVMVVYTQAALQGAGGDKAIRALVYMGVDEAQVIYADSLIDFSMRVVHIAPTNYTESTSALDLIRLQFIGDGYMDEVHTLRDTYKADIVSMWGVISDACGRGYIMSTPAASFESAAFNVNDWGCAVGNYTWVHELGHNMGCQHDRQNAGSGSTANSYSFGWRWNGISGTEYRSIMAYAPGIRVGLFSNPNVLYDGVAAGVPVGMPNESYNAKVIQDSRSIIANWRMRSDDLLIEAAGGFAANGEEGGPFSPTCNNYTLTNRGVGSLNWTASAPAWLSMTPAGGTLAAGQSELVAVCFNSQTDALPKGLYEDNVTFTNTTAGYFQLREVELRVTGCTEIPFYDDFESGIIDENWKLSGTGSNRFAASAYFAPYAGSYHLIMDSELDGLYSRNEATLCLNVNGYTGLELRFWAIDIGDESHAPGSNPFVNGADFDGVAISVDNINWYEVQPLRGGVEDIYQEYTVDLDAALSAYTLTLGSAIYIRFNQYDNYGASSDGIGIDNVGVFGTPPNDSCATALPISLNTALMGSTLSADGTGVSTCAYNDTQDLWYLFTPASSGQYLFSTCGSSIDTTLALYDACGGNMLACNDDAGCALNIRHAEICQTLSNTAPIWIRVSGYDGAAGNFSLIVTDDCSQTGGEPPIFSQGEKTVWKEVGDFFDLVSPDQGTAKANSFEWTFSPAGGGPIVVIPGAFSETLSLTNLQLTDSGDYTVRFYNGTGMVIYTWHLSVFTQLPLPSGVFVLGLMGIAFGAWMIVRGIAKRRQQH